MVSRHRVAPAKDWLQGHLRSLLFVNAYFLILAYAATEGAGFVFWVIAARLYSSTETGLAATAISATKTLPVSDSVINRLLLPAPP